MNDIEKITKIAKLTQELKKHGIAEDTVSALMKSEDVYGSPVVDDPSKKKSVQVSEVVDKDVTGRVTELEVKMNEVLLQLSDPQKNVNNEDSAAKENASSIHTRLGGMESQMGQVIKKVNEIISEIKKGQEQQKLVPEQKQAPPEKKEMPQRTGNYTPDDVAVDKVFYFGKK